MAAQSVSDGAVSKEIDRIRAVFPTRPLRLKPEESGPGKAILFLLFATLAGVLLGGWMWTFVPDIISDHQLAEKAQPLENAGVRDGHCRTSQAILTTCDMTLYQSTKNNGRIERKISLMFIGSSKTRSVMVVGDPAHPEMMTTDLAIDAVKNRAITVMGIIGLVVVVIFYMINQFIRLLAKLKKLKAMSNQVLTPIDVDLYIKNKIKWIVEERGGSPVTWVVTGKREPFFLSNGRVLAVTAPNGAPFPLDAALTRLDLTDAERTRVKQASKGVVMDVSTEVA